MSVREDDGRAGLVTEMCRPWHDGRDKLTVGEEGGGEICVSEGDDCVTAICSRGPGR